MTNVTSLDDYRPTLQGEAICTECKHTWQAVIPETDDKETLECPSCQRYFGVFRGTLMPEVFWRCNDCESDLFYLTPEGHQCRSCGRIGNDWQDSL